MMPTRYYLEQRYLDPSIYERLIDREIQNKIQYEKTNKERTESITKSDCGQSVPTESVSDRRRIENRKK